MDKKTLNMLKELTEAPGVSGFESEVRAVIRKYMQPISTIEADHLGSIICKKKGSKAAPKVMLPGHMDEIGFMVKLVDENGFVRFSSLGGWFSQVVLSQRVVIKTSKGDVPGITGSKPPHLLTPEERKKVIELKDMFIDVGAKDKEEAEKKFGIRVGDPIIPVSPFMQLKNKKMLLAKAWDDRVGCGMFMSALMALRGKRHPNTVYGVGTVQEEVGIRGARTSAWVVEPDVCLVLESGIAADTPGIKPEEAQGKLGEGPIIYLLDSGMIPNVKLRDLVIEIAERKKIPYQLSVLERGATDGASIHLHQRGVPCICISVPVRYIHSHVGIINSDDYDNAVRLLVAVIQQLDSATVAKLKQQ